MHSAGWLVAGVIKLNRELDGITTKQNLLQMLQPHLGVLSADLPHLEKDDSRHV